MSEQAGARREGGIFARGKRGVLWIAWYADGPECLESTESTDYRIDERKLRDSPCSTGTPRTTFRRSSGRLRSLPRSTQTPRRRRNVQVFLHPAQGVHRSREFKSRPGHHVGPLPGGEGIRFISDRHSGCACAPAPLACDPRRQPPALAAGGSGMMPTRRIVKRSSALTSFFAPQCGQRT